jgi:catechol 2,3-dioxygenase-like lactoylglutathione lyase family enzyme
MATNQSITDGIPTARNVDHFGYNVPNLDEAIDFFVEVLGAEEAFRWGPMADRTTIHDQCRPGSDLCPQSSLSNRLRMGCW